MARKPRSSRKGSDAVIVMLNSVGISSKKIASMIGVHPSTICNRLKSLGVDACDTRRSFMEDVLDKLTPAQREWLSKQVGPHMPVNQYVTNLIVQGYVQHLEATQNAKPRDPEAE